MQPTASDSLTVTGAVLCRERIVSPRGAVVTVTLEDVSRMDAPAAVPVTRRITDATGGPVPEQHLVLVGVRGA